MSLVALALRIATVKALTGMTSAGVRVFDSSIDDIDVRVEDERSPFVVVYTDDEDVSLTGKELTGGTRSLSLVIHAVVADAVMTDDGETSICVPHTDEGLEATLDLLRFDILRQLQAFGGEWGDLWRGLVIRASKLTTRRGASAHKGVRFAAREIMLDLEPIADPYPGMALVGPWADIDRLFRTDPDLASLADLIAARHRQAADLPLADSLRATLGLSRTAARALSFRDAHGNAVIFS